MSILSITLSVISFVILAAHFLRVGDFGSVSICLILPLLLLKKEVWARYVIAFSLLACGFIWTSTGYTLVSGRIYAGMPWIRLLVIMTATLLLILVSMGLQFGSAARMRHAANTGHGKILAIIFAITFLLLEIIRNKVPIKIILADRFFYNAGRLEVFLLSLYAVWIGGKMLDPDISPRIRQRIWCFFSFIFFIQLILGLAGLDKFLMSGKLHLPVPALILSGPLFRLSNFFMPILFISTIILVGSAWCSHLCYIGAWDDSFSRLGKRRAKPLPAWTKKARAAILCTAVLLPLALRFFKLSATMALIIAALFGIAGIFIMALISRRLGLMAHCTVYCPIGLIADTLGKISLWRIKIKNQCNSCGMCSRVCRYNALNSEDLKNNKPGISCSLCGDCISSCKTGQIYYSFPGLSPSKARAVFISLIVIIHTIFLCAARI